MSTESIYDFELPRRKGDPVPMKNYEGKVLIIVNTATGYPPCAGASRSYRCI